MTKHMNCSHCGKESKVTMPDLRKEGQAIFCDSCRVKLGTGQINVKQVGDNKFELHEQTLNLNKANN